MIHLYGLYGAGFFCPTQFFGKNENNFQQHGL